MTSAVSQHPVSSATAVDLGALEHESDRLVDRLGLSLLAAVDSPAELKRLSKRELPRVASQMREFLLATLDETGGHFGANLGTVELAIALHFVFESPHDALVWDTGHQAYPHKILTGRRDDFCTLRMQDGLSGFLRRDESPHDIWGAGHASTALPAALGISAARAWDDPHWVIAVVGDGAMTGGVTLSGLNNAGLHHGRLLVILNDNGMSIAPNVGAISRYLSTIKARPDLQKLNRVLKRASGSLPLLRRHGSNLFDKVKKALHYFWLPGPQGAVFDLLGYNYYGPFDGHDVEGLVNLLSRIKSWEPSRELGPVLLHVITEKGHGFKPAEADPYKWHAAKPRSIAPELAKLCAPLPAPDEDSVVQGRSTKPASVKTYTQVFAEALIEQMRQRPEIVAITAAMPDGTGLDKVAKAYPERTVDVGICEEFAVNFACGLAIAGKRPVCAIYSTFLQRAYDQIIHDVGIQQLPVVFALDRGGFVGADGETHQGLYDLSYLRTVPGMLVMAPRDENELRQMLVTALAHGGPAAFRFPRGNASGTALDDPPQPIPIGQWELLREGKDVALLAVGPLVTEALSAAEMLASRGIQAYVVNARFIKPLDEAMLSQFVRNPVPIITAEENVLAGGFGSAVGEWLSANAPGGGSATGAVRLVSLGVGEGFVKHATQEQQRALCGLDSAGIASAALRLLREPERPERLAVVSG